MEMNSSGVVDGPEENKCMNYVDSYSFPIKDMIIVKDMSKTGESATNGKTGESATNGKTGESATNEVLGDIPQRKTSARYLDPKMNLPFNRIFSSKLILENFLNDMLSEHARIADIEQIETVTYPLIWGTKTCAVDILCRDTIGNKYLVEMQVYRYYGYDKEEKLSEVTLYARHVSDTSLCLKKVFVICVSGLQIFPEEVGYLSFHTLSEKKTNMQCLADFEFIFVELPKFLKGNVSELTTMVDKWAFFFKYAHTTTDEEIVKLTEGQSVLKVALEKLSKYNYTDDELFFAYEKIMHDEASDEDDIQMRIEKAVNDRLIKIIKFLSKKNVSADIRAKCTGLSLNEVKDILDNTST